MPTPIDRRPSLARYPKLYASFLRYCFVRELGYRFNFITRAITGVGWLLLLVFYFDLIFGKTKNIGDWNREEYYFLMGTWFVLYGLVECLFLENCTRFSELVRTGNLDTLLTKPIDAQFLASLERIDWAELPSVCFGAGLTIYATWWGNLSITPARAIGFVLLVLCGVAILYSFMITLASISVWVVRTQSLHELWFYIVQFGRYPSEIYGSGGAGGRDPFSTSLPRSGDAGDQRACPLRCQSDRPGHGRLHGLRRRRASLTQPLVLLPRSSPIPKR